ncbi:MAG: DUF3267 domain-containing protein [Lachnospiraceae bacterium]|nr:DUF3267 domain-containing protein [Lachnospiraceae bacterium]
MAEEKQRKLTKAEQKRKANFEVVQGKLEAEGYHMVELTMTEVAANALALFSAGPFIVLMIVLFKILNPGIALELDYDKVNIWLFFLVFFGLIVVHELIHGLTWGLCAESGFKAIAFGFIVQYITPYCTCSEPLKKRQMILGALMPTIVLGLIPGIVAMVIGAVPMFYMACFLILGGGGDLMVVAKILMYKSHAVEKLYYDHPYKVGLVVFEK